MLTERIQLIKRRDVMRQQGDEDFPLFRESIFYLLHIPFLMFPPLCKESPVRFIREDFIDDDGLDVKMILVE